MGTSMEKIRELVDVNTIIGDPITSPDGTIIIPVSKVSFGFVAGGSDLPTKAPKEVFAGGSGAVVSLKPAGFLLDDGKGCRYIHAGDEPIDNLIDKASDFIHGLRHKSV
mgnify:CR=1 FL=1